MNERPQGSQQPLAETIQCRVEFGDFGVPCELSVHIASFSYISINYLYSLYSFIELTISTNPVIEATIKMKFHDHAGKYLKVPTS